MPIETLEQAREELLRNTDQIRELTETNGNLTTENENLRNQVEELRTLNQRLFLRATQGKEEPEKEEPEPKPLEEVALELKGVL